MTKHNIELLRQYDNTKWTSLYEAYENPSANKRKIYDDCLAVCKEKHGYNYRIVSRNTYVFTFAFKYKKDGKTHLFYMTPAHDYDFEVEDYD